MTVLQLFVIASMLMACVSAFGPANMIRRSATNLKAVKLVVTDDSEPIENALKRFKRAVNQSGHLMELRHKELWETAADKRKRKAERARQLNRIERTVRVSAMFCSQTLSHKYAHYLSLLSKQNDRYERKHDGSSEYNS